MLSPARTRMARNGLLTGLVYDDFNRADGTLGTSLSGHAWTTATGSYAIVNGYARQTPRVDAAQAFLDTGATDVLVSAKIPNLGSEPGITARYANTTNYYLTLVNTTGGLRLFKRVAGTFTQLGSTVAGAVAAGNVISLYVSGTSLEARVNGVAIITATDSALSAGTNCGLTSSGTGGTCAWDNFSVQAA